MTSIITGEQDAELVKSITKEDVNTLFLTRIHQSSPTRAKISVHLLSQKVKPKKISLAAMEAFESTALEQGFLVDGEKWREELTGDGEPLLAQFVKYWLDTLSRDTPALEKVPQILAALPGLMEKFPAEGDYQGKLKEGVTFIEDAQAFKASLRVSDPPSPLVEWGDLPRSKF